MRLGICSGDGRLWFVELDVRDILGHVVREIMNIHQSTQQTTTRVGALKAHHPAWVSHQKGVPGQHPQYTRAWYAREAVGGSAAAQPKHK